MMCDIIESEKPLLHQVLLTDDQLIVDSTYKMFEPPQVTQVLDISLFNFLNSSNFKRARFTDSSESDHALLMRKFTEKDDYTKLHPLLSSNTTPSASST